MPAERQAAAGAQAPERFGVLVAGVPLLLPAVALEHVAAATVFPLPGAGEHVLGLMQLRGHPVVVLDAGPAAEQRRAPAHRASLLVIGTPPEAGALVVDGAPRAVRVAAGCPQAGRPQASFADALGEALQDADDGSTLWWHFDPRKLFELLAGR
ncbi:chemotaxis protein CheW [Quisquiliibacterium transsilvanicum]|uniref:Chemotaxis signal transduction protein n=1 Tax=Quisquiliibacterium transsilvanicum TaxID=1549638 RepID=A0A7W8M6Q7_9BURK|nr:chemotaxis protein CheW [Quisquiliibacterium transsilvanicum]MBB5270146.1 chemotaxis signal transduction protein [Quisquiliibacterium transsilvanicum]